MKTLDQIDAKLEKRTPISSLPFTITQSGSYYFTGNLTLTAASGDAITVATNHVTIDLNGFRLGSLAAVTGSAIVINASLRNIEIKNGVIFGTTTVSVSGSPSVWTVTPGGFNNGIDALSPGATNCVFRQLRISGCRATGLEARGGAVIEQVTATQNGGIGIRALEGSVANSKSSFNGGSGLVVGGGSVNHCIANFNEGIGISADSVSNCTARGNGFGGIGAVAGSVTNSRAVSNQGVGIDAVTGSVTNCTATANQSSGISASSGTVTNSTAINNGLNGILATNGVVAFCKASGNNTSGGSGVDIEAAGATRTGNNPAP